MATVNSLMARDDKRELIRKIQSACALLGSADAELPERLLTAKGKLVNLKSAGWRPVGMIGDKGYTFGREQETENIDALGYASPVRSDVTTVPRTISFTPLEKGRRHMLELQYGVDLSGVTQDPETGEIVFDEPDLPVNAEYKLLVIGIDGPKDREWVMGKGYGAVKLQNTAEEVWGREGAVASEITLDVFPDENGVPVRHYLGGTGALAYKEVLGFEEATETDSDTEDQDNILGEF
ncbi:hypothetical protein QDX25_07245 [Auritidibacter ignavus]|uniref:hypothetical protein n=1 Tax=Auritidibacter ignavus TaxID=678932 RepID=UPI002448720E|nr:hypothetical protein [Auritidibacter ignavus]WGH80603.1 hypothetical protein QDX25_07245 [Auritidibacter ignavus]